jgi:hypothetical protein
MRNETDNFKAMKRAEFINFGVPVVAYIKRVDINGLPAFALHGADGEPLGIEESEDMAVLSARYKNMLPVKVQ